MRVRTCVEGWATWEFASHMHLYFYLILLRYIHTYKEAEVDVVNNEMWSDDVEYSKIALIVGQLGHSVLTPIIRPDHGDRKSV